jgi:hypothetical protein
MAEKKTQKSSVGLGLTIASLTAIAGAVFLYGTEAGKKKRKQIKGWTLKAKGEVLEQLEKLKEVNEEKFHQVVDTVSAKYQKLKTVAPEDLAELSADLKKSWKHIVKATKAPVSKKVTKKK